MHEPGVEVPGAFRLLLVPGVTPTSWLRTWAGRLPDVPLQVVPVAVAEQAEALRSGRAQAGLVRLPLAAAAEGGLAAIPLFTETTVVVLPADHLLTALDEVGLPDLADEVVLVPGDDVLGWVDRPGRAPLVPDPATTAEAVELVAAGVGVLVVPQSLARLHHRKDLTYRVVDGAPASQVALAWPAARHDDLVEELIGIVRGRTVNSSRGRRTTPAEPAAAPAPAPRRSPARAARGRAPRRGGRR